VEETFSLRSELRRKKLFISLLVRPCLVCFVVQCASFGVQARLAI